MGSAENDGGPAGFLSTKAAAGGIAPPFGVSPAAAAGGIAPPFGVSPAGGLSAPSSAGGPEHTVSTSQFPFSPGGPAAAAFGSTWGPVVDERGGLQESGSKAGSSGFFAGTSTPGEGTSYVQVEAEKSAPEKLMVVPPFPESGPGMRLCGLLVRAL